MINNLDGSGKNEFNFFTFVLIDGKYANQMALI